MRKVNLLICAVLFAMLSITSCQKEEFEKELNLVKEDPIEEESSFSIADRPEQPTILGEQKENPFSIENMEIALDSLIAYANETGDAHLKSASNIEITPTDLYVRFLPKDSVEYNLLSSDTTLTLFDIPLDYKIEQLGDYYYDSTVTTPYTWQYTTVKPDYVFPYQIEYELLSELFIIENHPDYTEEIIDNTTNLKSASTNKVIDQDICNALYAVSFTLTGNDEELGATESNLKSTVNCRRKCIWRACWTTCDTYYYPDGTIKVNTPKGDVGLKGVTVRMWRWFSYTDAVTYSNGNYYSRARFNKVWAGNSINYKILFKGKRGNNRWTFNKSIAGAVCLWRDSYGMGRHSPNGHSMTFYTNSSYWGRCVLSNAIYDYIGYASRDGLALPPSHLDIADKNSSDFTSSAPLLKSHFNFSLVYTNPYWGSVATIWQNTLFRGILPDLILRFTNNKSDYNKITAVAWHELTHASQLQRMKSEKGYWWASDYWSANVCQQAKNYSNSSSSYGAKGDSRWAIIALSEGWANYREEFMVKTTLGNSSYVGTNNSFLTNYVSMFKQLRNIGCSYSNIEKSICTYSISGFKDILASKYSSKSSQIKTIVSKYE